VHRFPSRDTPRNPNYYSSGPSISCSSHGLHTGEALARKTPSSRANTPPPRRVLSPSFRPPLRVRPPSLRKRRGGASQKKNLSYTNPTLRPRMPALGALRQRRIAQTQPPWGGKLIYIEYTPMQTKSIPPSQGNQRWLISNTHHPNHKQRPNTHHTHTYTMQIYNNRTIYTSQHIFSLRLTHTPPRNNSLHLFRA